ncbi:hypothetical protein Val02_03520 [Virgisporangium aliadipatigenens]|uniref:HEAT repeat domain-containing protein n=1 Tax=Virgisporangium aliadipatigenens TaxID=741659 RepID=A0A8J4DN53_9ACTN|nr:hypothetical protein [Virgisporangium aliadipatigenens]GIJ43466.1 hypothetical protein Val02_03520 [Virgisporangium aliadipatigenens]
MTDYGALFHAYGPATDTPGHLAALAGDDPAAHSAALRHLRSAVIHQGTPWTATPPAALEIAALVGDSRLAGPDRADLRATLLDFLAAVAEAGEGGGDLEAMAAPPGVDIDALLAEAVESDDEEAIWGDEVLGGALYARAKLGCRAIVPTLLATAVSALADPEPAVRAAAAHAVGACGTAAPGDVPVPADGPERNAWLGERLDALAAAAREPHERAALVLAVGDLGLRPARHLADPHPGVRACAALAPALAGDPAATAEILAALADPAATDRWFDRRLPQVRTRLRFSLVNAAIARVEETDRLLPAAVAVARIATLFTVDAEWGPLLRAFFADGPAEPFTAAQRRYLGALVDNADLWNPGFGNAGLVFRRAGLPYDREACRALVHGAGR